MNWIHSFFKKYQFQLWLIGCTSCEQLKQIIHDKNKKIEQIIASEPNYACWYAIDIMVGPWPPGEKAIASDPFWKSRYDMICSC